MRPDHFPLAARGEDSTGCDDHVSHRAGSGRARQADNGERQAVTALRSAASSSLNSAAGIGRPR